MLIIDRVGKRFGERVVLADVSLILQPGERVALLGESGSGKSTLLNVIAGLEPHDHGTVQVMGEPVDGRDPDAAARLRRTHIGFVFQAFHLLPYLDAQHNVALPLLLSGSTPAAALARAREALARVGLAGHAGAMPAQLSGGEQQRVALMRALVHRPSLVLADEPTGNLDPKSAAQALRVIEEQVAETGAALLLVTHSEQAAAIAHRRVLLVDERLRDGAAAR
ncbi:MAG TPA: ABC transporter ATP-binding protein [Burkholderiaceae bacterium]|nr:ABC transporter ATP-binding protein [Burkholderiaceae bacterium]